MHVDYDRIAKAYDAHRRSGGPYMAPLLALARRAGAKNVLELGTGTGNCADALHAAHPCALTGLDRSRGMLAQAREKSNSARNIQADAVALPFRTGAFDFLFAVYLIHHIADLNSLMAESFRVLHRGYAVFVSAPHAFIRNHPMNRYFPSFADVDLARFPHEDTVASALRRASFHDVSCEIVSGPPTPVDAAYASKVSGKFISTYELLPPDEYAAGMARLHRDLETRGTLDFTITLQSVIIQGRR